MFFDEQYLVDSGTGILPVRFIFRVKPACLETHGQDARATNSD
jgi:hypothetical protein